MKRISTLLGLAGSWYAVVIVVLLGAFLRLYRLGDFTTFLGDQGRDAIVMKDIVTLSHMPALGPITSVGSIFLGPLYYYMMAPWLGLFRMDPVGPAYGVAIISSLCLIVQYLAIRDILDHYTALLSTTLTAVSWTLVEYSRFSWNPNLLAPVSLFIVYVSIKASTTHRIRWYVIWGALLSIAIQLHYLAAFLLPYSVAVYIYSYVRRKRNLKTQVITFFAMAVPFVVLIAPFLVFELIHHFPNTTSALNFANQNSHSPDSNSYSAELMDTLRALATFAFHIDPSRINNAALVSVVITLLAFTPLTMIFRRRATGRPVLYVIMALIFLLLGTAVYHGPKFAHYLGAFYILIYVLVSYICIYITRSFSIRGARIPAIILLVIAVVYFGYININTFFAHIQGIGPRQIYHARRIAQGIFGMQPSAPYAITSSPEAYADYPYRYFLDAWGRKPTPKENDAYVQTQQLYVVCEKKCNPMGDSQWAIAHFNPQKIAGEKQIDSVYIYKLTR